MYINTLDYVVHLTLALWKITSIKFKPRQLIYGICEVKFLPKWKYLCYPNLYTSNENFVHYIFHDNYTPEIIFNDGNIHSIILFNQLRKKYFRFKILKANVHHRTRALLSLPTHSVSLNFKIRIDLK